MFITACNELENSPPTVSIRHTFAHTSPATKNYMDDGAVGGGRPLRLPMDPPLTLIEDHAQAAAPLSPTLRNP